MTSGGKLVGKQEAPFASKGKGGGGAARHSGNVWLSLFLFFFFFLHSCPISEQGARTDDRPCRTPNPTDGFLHLREAGVARNGRAFRCKRDARAARQGADRTPRAPGQQFSGATVARGRMQSAGVLGIKRVAIYS